MNIDCGLQQVQKLYSVTFLELADVCGRRFKPEGKFKAAEARFTEADQIDISNLTRWLKKSIEIQWDYKNIVRRNGVLERFK